MVTICYRFFKKANMIITTRIATNQAVCMWIMISCPVADVAISISYSPTYSRFHQARGQQYTCRLQQLQSLPRSG